MSSDIDRSVDAMRLISPKEAVRLTSLSRTQIDRYRKDGRFPVAISLGEKRIAFSRPEVFAWIQDRLANGRLDK